LSTTPPPITNKKKRVVSGMRPTGRLHIGHYFGALQNWVRLQNAVIPGSEDRDSSSPLATHLSPLPAYDCFYFIADWHALTSDYADTGGVAENTIEIVTDYLAAGLEPGRDNCTIFQQSLVPEHAELHLLLGMVTPLSWLERVPTYKEQIENVTNKDLHTYGFLGYPCLQTADIVMYSSPGAPGEPGIPLFVPVGEDQVSHVELSREIVRKFNLHNFVLDADGLASHPQVADAYMVMRGSFDPTMQGFRQRGTPTLSEIYELQALVKKRVNEVGLQNYLKHLNSYKGLQENHIAFRTFLKEPLVEPQYMLTKTPRIPGLDGRKMSKSYGNAITLSESDDDIRKKTKVMVTDPARKRRTDPGNPEVCPVYDWHKLFSTPETLAWAAEGCRTAGIGCIECKAKMADHLIEWITPIRERRVKYEQHPAQVLEVIDEGSKKAREVAKVTMERVREAVFGWQKKRNEIKTLSFEVHDTHA
jgi:tryptophanyl-tRNA synthetase